MKKKILRTAKQYVKQDRRQRNWRKLVRVMACVVVFCTTYAMILPAITMERDTCSLTEHIHSESCYEKVLSESVAVLSCDYDTLDVHVHTADCLDAQGDPVCGEADYLVHTHSGECLNANGALVCRIPEVEEHEHSEDCYGVAETEPAETETAEATEATEAEETQPAEPDGDEEEAAVPELICGKEEISLHSHDEEDCYEAYLDEEGNEQKRLICTQVVVLEHKHGEGCYVTEEVPVENADALICDLAEGHVHAEGCYDETGALICAEAENHAHGEMCYGTWKLICGLEEHTHTEGCKAEDKAEEETEPNTLRYRGWDYEVTVRYDDAAGIPENAQLAVRELSGEEYRVHLDRVYEELGIEGANTLIQLEREEGYSEDGGNVAVLSGQISFARFFDITILVDGQEIEPQSTVEVTVIYDETVEIPDGEKTAVHFNHNGTVEILDTDDGTEEQEPMEPETYAVQSVINTQQTQTENNENNNVFVFRQDSFSVITTIVWSETDQNLVFVTKEDKTIPVEWLARTSEKRTIHIEANFEEHETDKVIEVKVPTGYKIISYSSPLEPGTTPDGVTLVEIDKAYRDLVTSAELGPAVTHGGVACLVDKDNNGNGDILGETWGEQVISGYTVSKLPLEGDIRTYGGVITWKIDSSVQTVNLNLTLAIQPELLSHTQTIGKERMGDIVITVSNDEDFSQTVVTTIEVTATDVPLVWMTRGSDSPCLYEYYAAHESGIYGMENRSDRFPISCTVNNYLTGSVTKSYAEEAVFTLTYPKGVYYEQGTAFCLPLGLEPGQGKIPNLTKNGSKSYVDGHLVVTWYEDHPTKPNSITWTLKNFTMPHGSISQVLGAEFRADNTKYAVNEEITGFTFQMSSYTSNGKTNTNNGGKGTVQYIRVLLDGDKKDIRIFPREFMRRNVTADFGITDEDYVLGGFDVKSALAYEKNNFYFENPHDLKITALNLMGKRPRNIVIWTKNALTGKTRKIDVRADYPQYTSSYETSNMETGYAYNEKLAAKGVYGASENVATGTMYDGAYVALSLLGGQPGEYISACYFTVDTDQLTYKANYSFGGFTYIGQFSDEADGDKVQPVYLQQLNDDATYEMALSGRKGAGTENTHVYYNAGWEQNVFAADQSTIGWESTGVGTVTTTAKNQNGEAGQTYYPGSIIEIETEITSGYAIKNQEMLIDPVLVINLPKGISLDLDSVYLEKAEVLYSDPQYPGGKAVREEVAHSVEILEMDPPVEMSNATWTTYLIKQKADPYSVVASERHIFRSPLENHKIKAKFSLIVSSQCKNFNLPLSKVVMWDVRNTAGVADNLTGITEPSKNGDAIQSNYGELSTFADENNFLGHGPGYTYGGGGDAIQIKPLIGFVTDLSIKAVQSATADKTTTGFTTYDGQKESIVWVEPGKYVDVKLTYYHAHTSDYFKNTVIFVPIPKNGLDFGGKYFQNINLTDPSKQSEYKEFQFTMDLVGPVELISVNPVTEANPTGEPTQWDTHYAIDEKAVENSDYVIPEEGKSDSWRPIITYNNNNNPTSVSFYPADTINRGWNGCSWADVRMVMFTAKGNVPVGGSGTAVMRLYVHDRTETGPANFGLVNYWRAYAKAVTNQTTNVGIWAHTSVVAATPTGETVVGQIFVDNQTTHHVFTPATEPEYVGGKYTVELYEKLANGTYKKYEDASIIVDENGAFALKDKAGKTSYLPAGNYQLRIKDNDEEFYIRNGTSSAPNSYLGKESPENQWYNNVSASDGGTATFDLTIGNGEQLIHRIGVGVKPGVKVAIKGKKTLLGGGTLTGNDFTFTRYTKSSNGTLSSPSSVKNDEYGWFTFSEIEYQGSGTYNYVIRETVGNVPNMTYDTVDHLVTVKIVSDPATGRLIPTVTYDNSASPYEADRNVTKWAAFTNSAAHILEGKLFVDGNLNGRLDDGEYGYKGQTRGSKMSEGGFKVRVFRPGTSFNHVLTVDDDGSFACVDSNGNYIPLEPGTYRVTVLDYDVSTNNSSSFNFTNIPYVDEATGYNSIGYGKESPEGVWHNNAVSESGMNAWEFTIEEGSPAWIHRVGIAVSTSTSKYLYATKKFTGGTMAARDYKFDLYDADGKLVKSAYNTSSGTSVTISFGSFNFTMPGEYVYTIKEDKNYNTKPGIIYDTHIATAIIRVSENNDGTLTSTVHYNNGQGETTSYPVFTNRVGYELPQTGGAGTTSYTLGGLLMITAAILLYMFYPKRRKEDMTSF